MASAATEAAKAGVARRRWPLVEKRSIVNQTLSAGASVAEIARKYALHSNIVQQRRRLYHEARFDDPSAPQSYRDAVSAMFVPVRVVPAVRQSRAEVRRKMPARCTSVMHVMLASGSALRIESAAIDAPLVCAVVAELRR